MDDNRHNDAPVLRWRELGSTRIATIDGLPWELYADLNCWGVWVGVERMFRSPSGYRADRAQAERDAIAKLRSLGVVFRVEGE